MPTTYIKSKSTASRQKENESNHPTSPTFPLPKWSRKSAPLAKEKDMCWRSCRVFSLFAKKYTVFTKSYQSNNNNLLTSLVMCHVIGRNTPFLQKEHNPTYPNATRTMPRINQTQSS
mmetsp:Transcript_3320/g.7415  ORF Transcript_3320/g.7415 Transcript_3320/m.7415 type:complete len:117 (-) Transcript_3320:325-675(-)